MCFSAAASFGSSAVLGTIGVIAQGRARTVPMRLFATIPLIFSALQLTEGLLWLSAKDPAIASWRPFLTYLFLVMAMAIWPSWIPLTIRLLEKDLKRKKIMDILLGVGLLVSACVILLLFLYPVRMVLLKHHIHYEFGFPPRVSNFTGSFTVLYILSTILTPFVSGIKTMKWLGLGFLAAYLFAVICYGGFVLSVWCYFAALLSVVVLLILRELRKSG